MLGLLNKKISTRIGILVILIVATLAGWLMLRQYLAFMEARYGPVDVLINESI